MSCPLSLSDSNALSQVVQGALEKYPTLQAAGGLGVRYKKRRVLGRGSFGVVYKVVDIETGNNYAVKEIERPPVRKTEESCLAWKSVLTEIEVLSHIRHPNVITLHDLRCEGSALYLVTEHINGTSLHTYACNTPVSERDASEIAYHVLRGLQYLHAMGIVHRDVKPENILISRNPSNLDTSPQDAVRSRGKTKREELDAEASDAPQPASLRHHIPTCSTCGKQCPGPHPCCAQCGRLTSLKSLASRGESLHSRETCDKFVIKIIDFGSSKFIRRDAGSASDVDRGCTPVGTSMYLALEIIDLILPGESLGERDNMRAMELLPKSDMFSLGVMMFILLCRTHPFRGSTIDTLQGMREKMLKGVDFPDDANDLSHDAKSFLTGLLHLDPHQRADATSSLTHPWIVHRTLQSHDASVRATRTCSCPSSLIFSPPEERFTCCSSFSDADLSSLPPSTTGSAL